MYKSFKQRVILTKEDTSFILNLMHKSKNLYNEALYNVRQHFFKTNEYLSYNDNYHLLKSSYNYKTLNSSQAQAVIKKVDEAMKSFFGSLKAKVKKVRLPRYLDKHGYFPLVDRMVYKPNNGLYNLPRSNFIKSVNNDITSINKALSKHTKEFSINNLFITIKTPKIIRDKKINEITIKEKFDGKYIYVMYTYKDKRELIVNNNSESMGIDFGYNNLAVCATTTNNHLLIDGKKLKSYNQYYHKTMARLSSLRPDQNKLTKNMIKEIEKRNNRMTYAINKAAKLIINHALQEKVKTIIIGYNDNFKDESLSKIYNQWTKSIPIAKLRDRIIYLANLNDVNTKVINEAYTSKASYIDKDSFNKDTLSGVRVKRGLYKSKNGTLINADLNAALNIIRKGNPDALWLGDRGLNTPKRTFII